MAAKNKLVNRLKIKSKELLQEKGLLDLLDTGLGETVNVEFLDTADPAQGVDTITVGIKLKDVLLEQLKEEKKLALAVWEDEDQGVLSSTGFLHTATKGTIVSTESTNAIRIKTDANGEFECSLTNTAATAVYVTACSGHASPQMDCQEYDEVVFS